MKRLASVMSVATISLCATVLDAQERPNFSGRWSSEPDPTVAQPGRATGGGGGGGAATGGGGGAATGGGAARAGGGGGGARGGRGGNMGSGWGSDITITQDSARLAVQYMFFGRGDMQPPLRFIFALDGSETKNTVMMGRGIQEQFSKTAWDGSKLVITTQHTFPDPVSGAAARTEVKQVLSLESPTSLNVETTRAGMMGGPPTTVQTVYRKL